VQFSNTYRKLEVYSVTFVSDIPHLVYNLFFGVIGLTTFENTQIGTGKNERDISLENGPIKCIIYWLFQFDGFQRAATMWRG
jgi:hypothetical protein